MTKNTVLIVAVLMILVVVGGAYWVFMKSPKMSARDRYHSIGNVGINQRMTGKDYSYHSQPPAGAVQEDMINNTINLGASDSVMPAAYPASTRALLLGSHWG